MNFTSRQQLESMSTADLIKIADKYGIDFPDDLNRQFIIGELLEAEQFSSNLADKPNVQITDNDEPIPNELPSTYNNTVIDAVLRNPAWIYVFWDIKESDIEDLSQDSDFENVFLHISFFESMDEEKSNDSFDVEVSLEPSEQYIMIPGRKKFVRIDLAAFFKGKAVNVLASTRKIEIPIESEEIQNAQPGKKLSFSPLVQLSGIKNILHDHFLYHRQSFIN